METETESRTFLEAWSNKRHKELWGFQRFWAERYGYQGRKTIEEWEFHFKEWLQQDDNPYDPFV